MSFIDFIKEKFNHSLLDMSGKRMDCKDVETIRLIHCDIQDIDYYDEWNVPDYFKTKVTAKSTSRYKIPTYLTVKEACDIISYMKKQFYMNEKVKENEGSLVDYLSANLKYFGFKSVDLRHKDVCQDVTIYSGDNTI